ncbi:hypothetical protein ACFVXG_26850 [Kitasatospora sp. NPDC058162]|uniref:hypothetical protein n=1 Tax=Kitasatospora sp. NPDC058162 TaxID=3346362 RepID=UPI0036DBD3C4
MARPGGGYRHFTGTLYELRPMFPDTWPPGTASACACSVRRSRSSGSQILKSYSEDK